MAKPEPPNTGRLGFREPDEPKDGRPMILHRPFWTCESEGLRWLYVVETCRPHPGPGSSTTWFSGHLERIAEAAGVTVTEPPAKEMPK